jgi:NitT/TauT family transport system permease protein
MSVSIESAAVERAPVRLVPRTVARVFSGTPADAVLPLAIVLWAAAASVTLLLPDFKPLYTTQQLGAITAGFTALLLAAALLGSARPAVAAALRTAAPWLLALSALALTWQLTTAKHSLLPMPYFPPPQSILDAFESDGKLLLESVFYSLRLLILGFALGGSLGFLSGLAMGWSKRVNYWLHPLMRTIGPIPSTAWLPIIFVIVPSSFGASILIMAIAAWFPVTFLTWSGVVGVSRNYYDVARTLGANDRFLVWKVAVPAALPSVFVGIFMGLGMSFVTLLAAEILGVKAGLGWYITFAQGWAAYAKVYAALAIMAILFSGLITLLFRVRERALSWQRGLVR